MSSLLTFLAAVALATATFEAGWWLGARYATRRTRLRLLAILAGIDALNRESAAATARARARLRALHTGDSTPLGGR